MVEWRSSDGLTPYEEAVAFMEHRVAGIRSGEQGEMVWLVEHPPLYTGGTSAQASDLLDGTLFPVYETGRGGEYTYHGPGQRVAYVMLDLEQRGKDIRAYVKQLEQWIIATLAHFDVEGFTRDGRIGVWVNLSPTNCRSAPEQSIGSTASSRSAVVRSGRQLNGEAKIAALGIRVRKWVTYHGIAINVHPDLSHYGGIVPCGISEFGVTSLADLGKSVCMEQLDEALRSTFNNVF